MLNEQLKRILSQNLSEVDAQLLNNQEKLCDMEHYFSAKAKELGELQRCFLSEIEEIRKYEKDRQNIKIFLKKVETSIRQMRQLMAIVENEKNKIAEFKDNLRQGLFEVLGLIRLTMKKQQEKRQEIVQQMADEHAVMMHRLQDRHEEEVEKLKKAIVYLEKQLKKKSQVSMNATSRINTDYSRMEDQPSQMLRSRSNIKIYKQLNDTESPCQSHLILQQSNTPRTQKVKVSPIKSQKQMKVQVVFPKASEFEKILRLEPRDLTPKKHLQSTNQNGHSRIIQESRNRKSQNLQLPELNVSISYTPPIMNGFDVLIQRGREVYKGMWKRGVFEGRGKFYTENWIYDGEFKNGTIDGLGSLSFGNSTFIGKFSNGKACGEGTLYTKDRPVCGVWKDHKMVVQL